MLSCQHHADAELLALGEEFKEAQVIASVANTRAVAKDGEYTARRAPMPDACRPEEEDRAGLGLGPARWREGCYSPSQVDQLRALGPDRRDFEIEETGGLVTLHEVRRPNDLARAQEIVKAFDEWRTADEALKEETGCDDRDGERDSAVDDQNAIEAGIMRIPAKTMDGMRVKALVALAYENGSGQAKRPIIEGDDPLDAEDMMYQLAWDMLEMTNQSPERIVPDAAARSANWVP